MDSLQRTDFRSADAASWVKGVAINGVIFAVLAAVMLLAVCIVTCVSCCKRPSRIVTRRLCGVVGAACIVVAFLSLGSTIAVRKAVDGVSPLSRCVSLLLAAAVARGCR